MSSVPYHKLPKNVL